MKLSLEQGQELIRQIRFDDPTVAIVVRVHSEKTARAALEAGADYVHYVERDEVWTLEPRSVEPSPRP